VQIKFTVHRDGHISREVVERPFTLALDVLRITRPTDDRIKMVSPAPQPTPTPAPKPTLRAVSYHGVPLGYIDDFPIEVQHALDALEVDGDHQNCW